MTLVVAKKICGSTFLLGDALLTRTTGGGSIDVPGVFDTAIQNVNPRAAGLYQKLLVVSPNIAMAWAGSALTAYHVAMALRAVHTATSTGDLADAVDRALNNSAGYAEFIVLHDVRGVETTFTRNLPTLELSEGDRIAFGSGSDEFQRGEGANIFFNIDAETDEPSPGSVAESSTADIRMNTFFRYLLRLGNLFLFEGNREFNRLNFGGAYEAILWTEQGYQKVPISLLFTERSAGGLVPMGIFTPYYTNSGAMIMRRHRLQDGSWVAEQFTVKNFFDDADHHDLTLQDGQAIGVTVAFKFNPPDRANPDGTFHTTAIKAPVPILRFSTASNGLVATPTATYLEMERRWLT